MLAAALVAAAGVPLLAAPAAHATAYRYWSYWHAAGGNWAFSQMGADGWRVTDGSVEGWRFAVSPSTRSAAKPRFAAGGAFDAVCKKPADPGKVRVALLIDFGTAGDYPSGDGPPAEPLRGWCVQVPPQSTGLDVLREQGLAVRDDRGLICAIEGHPRTGCGEAVADPTPTRTAPTRPTPSSSATGPARPPRAGKTHSPGPTRSPSSRPDSSRPADATPSADPSGSGAPSHGTAGPTTTPDHGSPAPSTTTGALAPAGPPAPSGSAAGDVGAEPAPTLVVGTPVGDVSDSGTPWAAFAVAAAVGVLGAGAYWRRRRSS